MNSSPAPAPTKPTPPEDWECCQSECGDFCVYAIYAQEKQAYDNWLKQQSSNTPANDTQEKINQLT